MKRATAPEPKPVIRPTRQQLEDKLRIARQRGDRERVSRLLAKSLMTPRDTPPGSKP